MMKLVLVAIFFLAGAPSFGQANIRQGDVDLKSVIVHEEFRITHVKENLRATLRRVSALLEIKRAEKEQEALNEMRDILEEDIVFLRGESVVTEYELLELEWHHEAINTILNEVDKVQ